MRGLYFSQLNKVGCLKLPKDLPFLRAQLSIKVIGLILIKVNLVGTQLLLPLFQALLHALLLL